jgi:transcriptional regulator with XRE-family HTH domain
MHMKQATDGRRNGQVAADLAVGQRLRALRYERGLSLKAVAGGAGLSIGYLSQVERGLSSPSLRVLTQVADLLGVGLAALFGGQEGPEADGIVTRAGERAALTLFLMQLAPGASTGDEALVHDGEEAGLVMEGALVLRVEDATAELGPGDSFRFASRRPHRYRNPSPDRPALVLWVNAVSRA